MTRSKAYPSIDLATAVSRVEQFNKNLGAVGYHNRDKVALGIGYKSLSGASSRAIGALVHYGLLTRQKDTYALSELAKAILFPQTNDDRQNAIREALVEPALFAELVTQYEGKEIPQLLGNILTSPQYGINPKVKEEVASIFRASLDYAGALNGDQVRPFDAHKDLVAEAPFDPSDEVAHDEPQKTEVPSSNVQRFELILHDGSKAVLTAPYGVTPEDREKLKMAVDLFN